MPTHRLTKTGIHLLPLPARGNQILYSDPDQPGFAVRVTSGGAHAFVVDKNTKRGRIRITLGPAGTDALTIAQAREQARIALGLIAEGYTPAQIRDRLDRTQDRIPSGAMTLHQVLEMYLRERSHKLAERTKSDYSELVNVYLPDWKDRPLEAIDEAAVIAKFTSIKAPSRANYTFRLMRALFRYARSIRNEEGLPIVAGNPVDVLSQRRIWHDNKQRREVIELAALPAWWQAVRDLRSDDPKSCADDVRDWLQFLLLTGLRRTEASTLRWQDVDLRGRMFTVAVTKNREPHTLPLTDYLLSMLTRRDEERRNDYVFPGEADEPLGDPKRQMAKVIAVSGVQFSPHTLRRTFATVAESLDIPYLALQRLLNHKSQNVTGRHYTVINVERLRDPMQRITDFILRAAKAKKTSEVVPLRTRKSKIVAAR